MYHLLYLRDITRYIHYDTEVNIKGCILCTCFMAVFGVSLENKGKNDVKKYQKNLAFISKVIYKAIIVDILEMKLWKMMILF